MGDDVVHPDYYGGKDNVYEVIKVINAWDLDFNLGNVVKYVERAGKKNPDETLKDLRKARQYLDFAIEKASARPIPNRGNIDSLRPAFQPLLTVDSVPVCLKCGGGPQILSSTEGEVYAQCRKCGWRTEARDTEEKALAAWSGQMMFGKKEGMRCSMERRAQRTSAGRSPPQRGSRRS